MKKRILVAVVLIFVLALMSYLALNLDSTKRPVVTENKILPDAAAGNNSTSTPSFSSITTSSPLSAQAENLAAHAGIVMPSATNAPQIPPAIILENVRHAITQYGAMFGGNPVGTNPEITAALNGNNPKGINFIKPEAGMHINENGELVDAWGMPFFFHQLSGTDMEIHSAGPDKIMWTSDDLIIK